MKGLKLIWILKTLVTAGVLLCLGCKNNTSTNACEYQEKQFQRGQQLVKEGRLKEALEAFLKVTHKRTDAAESHLEVGRIYLQTQEDPIAAIYHFKQYLRLSPKSEAAPMVRQMIETAQKQFICLLPADPLGDDLDRLDLLQALDVEHAKVKQLEAQIQHLQSTRATAELKNSKARAIIEPKTLPKSVLINEVTSITLDETIEPAFVQNTHYTVKAGDSLAKISAHVYGTQARWKEILEANKNQLNSPKDLRPGQVLVIPN